MLNIQEMRHKHVHFGILSASIRVSIYPDKRQTVIITVNAAATAEHAGKVFGRTKETRDIVDVAAGIESRPLSDTLPPPKHNNAEEPSSAYSGQQ